jgi:hypothetical protein
MLARQYCTFLSHLVYNLFSIAVTIGCLVLHQRYQLRYARYLLLVQDVSSREIASDVDCDDSSPETDHTSNIGGCGSCESKPVVLVK